MGKPDFGALLKEHVFSVPLKSEVFEISKGLQLLPDFVADVAIVGMQSGERVSVSVDFVQREGFLAERTDDT